MTIHNQTNQTRMLLLLRMHRIPYHSRGDKQALANQLDYSLRTVMRWFYRPDALHYRAIPSQALAMLELKIIQGAMTDSE